MPSFPRFLSRVCGPFLPVLLVAAAATPGARAQFLPTGAATYAYNAPVNWVGGTINNVFSQVQTGAQNIAFLSDTTLTTGLTFNLGGTPRSIVLWGDGGDRNLTLGGDVSVSGTSTAVTFGSASAGFRLNIVLDAARTFDVAASNTLQATNVVSGGHALTKAGAGTFTLAGANTYSGGTIVTGGTLALSGNDRLLAGSAVTINDTLGGTAMLTLSGNQSIGALTFGGAGATGASINRITLNSGSTLTLGGDVVYDATGNPLRARIDGPGTLALGGDRIFNVGQSTANPDLSIFAPISGTGYTLTKTGGGRMDVYGPNSYTGGTIVQGGTLFLNVASPLLATSPVSINAVGGGGANLSLGVINETIGSLTFGGAGGAPTSSNSIFINTGGTLTLGGNVAYVATGNPLASSISGGTVALGDNRTFDIGNSSTTTNELTISSPVTGSGRSLTKTGAGVLTLSGANTYDGGTIVNGGTLALSGSGRLAGGSDVTINSTTAGAAAVLTLSANATQTIGTLNFSGSGGAASNNNVTLNAGSTLTLGGTVTYDGTNNPLATTIAGPGTLALGGDRTFNIGNSTANPDFFISAPISGTGFTLTKTGAGRMDLSGVNSYTGGTIVNGGILFLSAASPLQAASPVTVDASGGGTATYVLGAVNQTVGALTLGGASSTATSVNNVTVNPSGTLTLNDTVTYLATNNPLGSTIGPSGSGPGTVALGGNRTFAIADSTSTTNELTISIPVSGSGQSLTKTGAGVLTLSGANTYDGGTIVNGGTLALSGSGRLASASDVTINSTAGGTALVTLSGNATQTIGALTFGGAGSTVTSVNNVTIGTGATLTLGGTVTYDATNNPAASVVTGGTLALGGNRIFNVGDSSTATASDLLIYSVITGSGQSLTKTGAGRLGFQGSNTYDGGTIINGGTVFLNNSNNLSASGNVTVNNTEGGTSALTLLGNITQTIGALTFGGGGGTATSVNNVTIGTGATLTLGGTVTFNATGNPTASTVSTISGGTLALGGNRTFAVANSTGSLNELAISSVISGDGQSVTKTGAGRLYFLGASTYNGGTVLNGGQIFLGANNTLATTGAVTVNNTEGATSTFILASNVAQTIGTLTFGGAGASATSTNNVALNTGATLTLGGTVTYDATSNPAASTISGGSLALGGSRIFNVGDSTAATSSDLLISSVVTGSGQSLIKTGSGRLGLQAISNTYDGGTIINGGTVFLGASNTLATNGAVTVNNTEGGTARFVLSNNVTQTIGALTFGGAGGTATSVNNVTIGTGATLTLGGTVTFNATGNPTASTVSTISGGTLALGGNRTFAVANSTGSSNELAISSVISGAGQAITKTGAGRLYFLGANTYDGGTVLNGGQIFLGANNTLAATGAVTVNNTEGSTSTFILSTGVAQTIGTLAFGGAGGSTTSTNHVALNTGATLTLGGTVSYHATGSLSQAQINGNGTLALGGNRIFDIAEQASLPTELFISSGVSLGGTGYSLTKTGPGALGLEGASTYTGGTIVAAGVLAIWNPTGSATGTGPVTVQSGARIRGIGSVGGPTTLEAGAIAGTGGTGGTAGTLTFANGLTLNDGAVFSFQLGTTSDMLRLTGGTLTGASTLGSLTIKLTAGAGFGAGVYTLFDFSTGGVTTSSFDVGDFALGTTVSGYTYGLAMAGNTLQLTATASAIPEPSTYAAIFGALSLVGAALWRRRARRG